MWYLKGRLVSGMTTCFGGFYMAYVAGTSGSVFQT